jgi:membrane protease YdiL (CAAX protease family)
MNPWIDWGFVTAFAVAWPAYENWYRLPRVKAEILAGAPGRRVREYRNTMLQEWAVVAIALALVVWSGRPLAAIGLTLPTANGLWWTIAIVLVLVVLLVLQVRAATRDAAHASVRRQLAPVRWFLPSPGPELANFRALSISAGICEEILFRGYLIAFLLPLGGTAFALVLSSFLFGLGHAYQGTGGAIRAGILGLIMALLYQFTGSLLAPILVHALIDLSSGQIAAEVGDA